MDNSSRAIVNTIIQYIRVALSVVVTLYTSRVLLYALGNVDYGIYALISGVVFMLSFIQNSLTSATQRYLSLYQGKGDVLMQQITFQNSLFIQIFISLVLVLILLVISPLFTSGFLDIPINRLESAKFVYFGMVIMLFLSMMSIPYIAVLISHENILYSSVVLVLNTLLKVPVVLLISNAEANRLEIYVVCMVLLSLLDFVLYYIYCRIKYFETRNISLRYYCKDTVKNIFGFIGWSLYNTSSYIVRDQGFAIILNKMVGPVANASYGISRQVSGQIRFLSTSIQNAIKPQLVKAEGAKNRALMFRLSEIMSKFSFLILAVIALPIIFEMPALLSLWLVDVPEYAVFFCRIIILACLFDQLTIGLAFANEAIGKLKKYSLIIGTVKMITVPIVIGVTYIGCNVEVIMYFYLSFEFLAALLRIYVLYSVGRLNVSSFIKKVFVKELTPICITVIYLFLAIYSIDAEWRIILTLPTSALLLIISSYLFALCDDEHQIINKFIRVGYERIRKKH
ncbi:MAG: hypothetical protein R3Y59_00685 [bacterium]